MFPSLPLVMGALGFVVASTLGAEVPAAFAHTNRLVWEKSPYLLQHAHNPVDWYPWGEAAFARARAEDKPIFLSIGYSTCHWCHVMERESFENAAIAQRLNADFICIKVDREERPDVDHVYMTFVQATTGGGGWPMSVWLTPDLKPFYGGSYFPPEPRFQLPGFPQLLHDIAEGWRKNRAGIVGRSEAVMTQLQAQANAGNADTNAVGAGVLTEGFQRLVKQFDSREGGFGGAPKFPRPVTLNFLLRVAAREGRESRTGRQALEMTVFTLRKMIAGGVHDQLGGGFHRYAVDEFWHVPHFEKMLYDQAQLTAACLDAWQLTHDPVFRDTARDVLDYVARDLSNPAGGFYCAEDADSPLAADRPVRAEGAFYVWRAEEIQAALGPGTALFNFRYGVEEKGNAPAGSDPQREFTGKNILLQRHTLADAARKFKLPEVEIGRQLAAERQKLFALRALRPRPHRDDKILTAWNGLMISAAARAAQVLDEPADLERARRAAVFVRENLYRAETGTLLRSYRGGAGRVEGFVDDYAFLIQGLLDLYEASFDVAWLRWAEQLQDKQDALFWDTVNGAYFSAGVGDRTVLLRLKEDYDGAEPAPSSVAALNLLRLAQLTGRAELRARAEKIFVAFASELKKNPGSLPQLLVALDASLARPRQVVLAGAAAAPDTRALLRIVHSQYQPNKILLLADGGAGQAWLGERLEFLRGVKPIGGQATAFVCENFVCQLPTTDTNEVARLLFGGGK